MKIVMTVAKNAINKHIAQIIFVRWYFLALCFSFSISSRFSMLLAISYGCPTLSYGICNVRNCVLHSISSISSIISAIIAFFMFGEQNNSDLSSLIYDATILLLFCIFFTNLTPLHEFRSSTKYQLKFLYGICQILSTSRFNVVIITKTFFADQFFSA